MRKLILLIGFLSLLILQSNLYAFTISGTVVDEATQEPLYQAWVELQLTSEDEWGNQQCMYVEGQDTDSDGNFSFTNLTEGAEYKIRANKWGDYYSEWYDNVMGGGWCPKEATKISSDSYITIALTETPFKVDVYAPVTSLSSDGGKLRYFVTITNKTNETLSLKGWIRLDGPSSPSEWTSFDIQKSVPFTLEGRDSFTKQFSLEVPSYATDGWFCVNILVGPSETTPWEVTGQGGFCFSKGSDIMTSAPDPSDYGRPFRGCGQ